MRKLPSKTIGDSLHRAGVYTCMGVTGVCLVYCGWHAYTFVTKVKPVREKQLLEKKQQLLDEGAVPEQDLKEGVPRVQY